MNLKFTYEIERQDYVDFNKYHYLKTSLKRILIFGGLGIIVLMSILHSDDNLIGMIIAPFIYILFYIFTILRSLKATKMIPKDNGSILGKKELEFSDTGIAHSDKNSNGNIKWQAIKSLQQGSKAFYLYLDANVAIIIPKRVFENSLEISEFENYIKERLTIDQ